MSQYFHRTDDDADCIECGETSDDGAGWKGELAVDLLDEAEPDEVAVYCPRCWEEEFGDP